MRPTRRPLSLAIALSLATVLGACSSADGGDTATGSGVGSGGRAGTGGGGALASLQLASALQPFSSCDALLEHLKTEATARVTPYGLPGMGYGGYRFGVPEGAIAAETGAMPATTFPASAGAPVSAVEDSAGSGDAASSANSPAYSGTNTVEKDIDEGDIVKTDGTHLYLIDTNTGTLRVVAANDGRPAEAASLSLPGYPSQLVRVGSTLLVTGTPDETVTGPLDRAASRGAEIMPVWTTPRSVVWEVDISDAAAPRLVRQLVLDGSVASIRMTGDVARIVVQSPPEDLGFVQPSNPAGEQRALEANKDVIAGSAIDDWLGAYHLLDAEGGEISSGRLTGCDAVGRPTDFHGFSLTSVLSVDVTKGLSEPNAAGVLADSQQVYASAQHLYVAIGAWQDPIILPADVVMSEDRATSSDQATSSEARDDATTAIHQFRFDGDRATYTATGEVTGSLMNDFSMSEHDGVLRVATTAGAPWMWGSGPDSESFVTTLRVDGAELRQVGLVGELGKGERIYAVRFIGTNGYVVTFRQTDPLYVVDLSDPAAPTVTGELKINGYSAYLHPLSDGRLLGVGQDATDEGRITGAQVSIFDVSDPAAPTRTATFNMPQSNLSTEYDYKAFLYWAPEELVLLPYNSYGENGSFESGALGLDIGETITERGRIVSTPVEQDCGYPTPMPTIIDDVTGSGGPAESGDSIGSDGSAPDGAGVVSPGFPGSDAPLYCPSWAPPIERTVVIGPSVYAVAPGHVQAATVETLTAQGSVSFS